MVAVLLARSASWINKFLKMSPLPHGPTGTHPKFAVTRGASLFGPVMAEYIIGATIATHRHIYQLEANTVDGCLSLRRVLESLEKLGRSDRTSLAVSTHSERQLWERVEKERKEGEKWRQRQVESEWDKRLPKASDSFSSFISLEGDDAQHQNKLRAFLKDLDVIVNVLPSTSETHYLLGWRQIDGTDGFTEPLSVCKPSSILVNVGRGIVICEAAVSSALNKGFIRHANLDVFEEEPLPPT
ncbi:putative D-isomer specific 2-hydroxyacid dehydrogenase, NAD binding domain containing protein [Blattamonas nauphoetae]|uniref:D-isomer specific 2-hydroxyacid dehydrogenase, NAD binding domain containing protein n=1 Tax=Blattamonas nauphoetae TaxID=2049346 RepID=A0ABQ9X4A0_9EUKA|nr:putative D-isomer specific 2-hydroxyacid dehydrogenase, NAD binding domain containing protein [Blattamonas nauphoetae]